MKHGIVTLVIIMILKDRNFSSTIYSFFHYVLGNITTVEINSGIHLLKS